MDLKLEEGYEFDVAGYYNLQIAKSKLTYTRTPELTYIQKSNDIVSSGVSVGKEYIPVPHEYQPIKFVRDPVVKGSRSEKLYADDKLKNLVLQYAHTNRK